MDADTSSSGSACSRQRDRVGTDNTVYIIVKAVCFLCYEIYTVVMNFHAKIPNLPENIYHPFIHFLG